MKWIAEMLEGRGGDGGDGESVMRGVRPLWGRTLGGPTWSFRRGVATALVPKRKKAFSKDELMARMTIQPETLTTKLSNGLRVATEKIAGTEMATVGVYLYTGTRFETPETNGVAHFLEHLIFKGTNKLSQHELELTAENMGAHLNAYTSREQTVYFARTMKKDVTKIVGLLGSILRHSELKSKAVERERDVILRELQEVNQQTDETVFDFLHEVAYQGTPLAKTILGTPANIESISVEDLKNYVATHYTPDRMVIAAAGAVDHDEIVKEVEKHFGSMTNERSPGTVIDLVRAQPAFLTGSEVRVTNDYMPTIHFALAVESVGWTHPDSIAFMVFQALLGQYDRSEQKADVSNLRLPRSMALHADHCRNYVSFNTTYTDTGLFGVYAETEPLESEDVCLNILTEMVRPVFKLEEEALDRAKMHVKTTAVAALDGTQAIAEDIGRQMLVFGRRMPMSEFFARVDEVDVKKMKSLADNYIYDREVAFAAVGQIWALPDYSWLRRRTYWNSY